jgi:hypothetical protein
MSAYHSWEGFWKLSKNALKMSAYLPQEYVAEQLLITVRHLRRIALNDPLAGQRWGKARSLMFLDCPAFRADLKRRKDIKTASLERTRNKTRVVHGYVGRPAKGKPEPDPFAMLTAADEWAIRYRAKVADIPLAQCVRLYALMQGVRDLAEALHKRIVGDGMRVG